MRNFVKNQKNIGCFSDKKIGFLLDEIFCQKPVFIKKWCVILYHVLILLKFFFFTFLNLSHGDQNQQLVVELPFSVWLHLVGCPAFYLKVTYDLCHFWLCCIKRHKNAIYQTLEDLKHLMVKTIPYEVWKHYVMISNQVIIIS